MNQDCNTVARYVPLKNWRPKLHTKGCPFKELDAQVEVKHEMFWIFLRFWIEISFFNIFWQKQIEKKKLSKFHSNTLRMTHWML